MNEIKKFGILSSSVDPSQLSKTVEGAIIAVSGLLIYGAHLLGVNIGTSEISMAAADVGGIAGGIVTVFGLVRKLIVLIASLNTPIPPVPPVPQG